jgi:hypothetical protein
MIQSDSVHSTPRTNTSKIDPLDPTRRRLLTVAAARDRCRSTLDPGPKMKRRGRSVKKRNRQRIAAHARRLRR